VNSEEPKHYDEERDSEVDCADVTEKDDEKLSVLQKMCIFAVD